MYSSGTPANAAQARRTAAFAMALAMKPSGSDTVISSEPVTTVPTDPSGTVKVVVVSVDELVREVVLVAVSVIVLVIVVIKKIAVVWVIVAVVVIGKVVVVVVVVAVVVIMAIVVAVVDVV